MKSLSVIPHVGIGPLKLGMHPEQILDAIYQIRSELSLPDNQDIQISKDKEDDGFSLRYLDGSFFFMVRYRDNRAVEVAVDYELREYAMIMIYDMDVFQTQAEQLVTSLKQFSFCSYDSEDEQLSTNYEFSDIGVRLWREEPFHPKLLSDESYVKEIALIIDEMYHYLYIEIIAVK
jgi:hypothetical protein